MGVTHTRRSMSHTHRRRHARNRIDVSHGHPATRTAPCALGVDPQRPHASHPRHPHPTPHGPIRTGPSTGMVSLLVSTSLMRHAHGRRVAEKRHSLKNSVHLLYNLGPMLRLWGSVGAILVDF